MPAEFDGYAGKYSNLLNDPVRERFAHIATLKELFARPIVPAAEPYCAKLFRLAAKGLEKASGALLLVQVGLLASPRV